MSNLAFWLPTYITQIAPKPREAGTYRQGDCLAKSHARDERADLPYTPASTRSAEDGCGVGRVWVLAAAAAA